MSRTTSERPEAQEEKDLTVGEWVARHPGTARIFERHAIDYCCAGRRSLADACGRKGLDAGAIRAELMGLAKAAPSEASRDWTSASIGDLIANIISTHHQFLRTEEPRLAYLAAKVAHVHGERHPELAELADAVIGVFGELRPHLDAEERDFFPACLRWEAEAGSAPPPELLAGLAGLEKDHTAVGALLERIRALTAGFEAPPDACNSYRALFHGLEQLESDIHEHIHKENNILHARILARREGI
jgi:regulator of cell morphogenesis and NO signaling